MYKQVYVQAQCISDNTQMIQYTRLHTHIHTKQVHFADALQVRVFSSAPTEEQPQGNDTEPAECAGNSNKEGRDDTDAEYQRELLARFDRERMEADSLEGELRFEAGHVGGSIQAVCVCVCVCACACVFVCVCVCGTRRHN